MTDKKITAEQRARNFVDTWERYPSMVLGSEVNLLDRVQAFLFGIQWASAFRDMSLDGFDSFLKTFQRRLTTHISGSNNGVSWYDDLLSRHQGDEAQAFQEFIQILREIAISDGVIAPDSES